MLDTLRVTKKCHPDYAFMAPYYEDCYYLISKGDSKTVKSKTTAFLPKLVSQIRNSSFESTAEYKEYLAGAVWSEIPRESVNNIMGEMFSKPSAYNMPKIFDSYKSNITNNGNGINILESLITLAQLEYSKVGAMAYVSDDLTGSKLPKVALYDAIDIFNWHQVVNPDNGELVYDLVELRSNSYEMDPQTLEYKLVSKYIIHGVNPEGKYYKVTLLESEYDKYKKGGYKLREKHPTFIIPEFKGLKLKYVPFVVINASNVDGKTDLPILYSQTDLSVHAYAVSALYNKKLKRQTWALLVASGFNEKQIDQGVKSDGVLPSKNPDAKASYITPDSTSLEGLKIAWENAVAAARAKGIQISEKTQVESGIALENRIKNQSNAFKQIAIVRNEGILKLLGYICDWGSLGYTVENEWITPYTAFETKNIISDDLVKRGTLVNQGLLPTVDYYAYLKKHGETTCKNYTEYLAELKTSPYSE